MNTSYIKKSKTRLRGIGAIVLCANLVSLFAACGNAKAAHNGNSEAAFRYREVFLPEGTGISAEKFGLNTLDLDWGIWGHNLGKVLPESPSQNVYAKVNGNSNHSQFCFTSPILYNYIEEFIQDNYGEEATMRFSIIPNDNDIVCLCEKCVALGNTPSDASPAVTSLMRKLASRFPAHIFFTSDYKTTQGLPTDSMPSNTGVLVSAINFPLSYEESPEETKFMQRLQAWGQTTPRILVWDYINNFDDYFTPYPTLGVMQRRLRDYRDNNVTAVFLNGSGYDISAMSGLRTAVLAELTANPDIDWKKLLYEKAQEFYPTAGNLIAGFMVAQEEDLEQSGASLPLYEGVAAARKSYLNDEKFIEFHDQLLAMRSNLEEEEREYVDLLLGELALTRLELNRINGNLHDSERYLQELEQLAAMGYPSYNESGWSIEGYVEDYRYLLSHLKEAGDKNKLKGEKLIPLTALDPDYTDISILTDGVLGIPSNYHNGNLIVSPEKYFQVALPSKPGMKKIKVWMSYNPAYKVNLPEKVTLSAGDVELAEANPEYPSDASGHGWVEFDVPSDAKHSLVLSFHKKEGTRSIAIEEIEGY